MRALVLVIAALQDPPKVSDYKVDQAVGRGVRYLAAQYRGANRDAQHPLAGRFDLDELVLYTLIHGGMDLRDPLVARLVERTCAKDVDRTYNAALGAMALEAYDRGAHQWRIAHFAQFLVDNQAANGQWSYGRKIKLPNNVPTGPPKSPPSEGTRSLPAIRIKRQGKGPATGDNSNSQYAALGLRACAKAGLTLPDETLPLAATWWETAQRGDGSWGYNDEGLTGDAGYGAMTAGGVASLVIVKDLQKLDGTKHAAVRKGLEWMAAHLDFACNPSYHHSWMWQYYWIYAIERAGDLARTERIGSRWWYAEGCEHLFGAQQADGSWVGLSPEGKESVGGAIADTCFAILFLRRATRGRPSVASGK